MGAMAMQRVRVHWTGFTGGPGVNTLFFTDTPADPAPDLHTFFDAIKALIPTSVTVAIDSSGDLIDETTGALGGTWTGTAGASVTGTTSALYAGPTGAVMDLKTSTVVGRRRLQGRMFLVPLTTDCYQSDGTLATSSLGTLQTAASAFLASSSGGSLVVWHRPKPGQNGSKAAVTSIVVPDLAAVLRSRR